MEYFKLQIGCMVIVLLFSFIYVREKFSYKIKSNEPIFNCLLIAGILSIFFDGTTAYTVNHLEEIPDFFNRFLHLCFLASLDIIVFLMFLYVLDFSRGLPKKICKRILLILPLILNIFIVVIFIPQLEFRTGEISNYSMGISAYTCFIMVFIYTICTFVLLFSSWKNIGRQKRIVILTAIATFVCVSLYQTIYPQALITSLGSTILIISLYLNMENPLFLKLKMHNKEMVVGFATLIENRDDNTGGHIKRTSEYVEILAKELSLRGLYSEILTYDYINNLVMAAPMHDIGKIAIPDSILQKPARLTPEEFEIMKTHSERGSKIIKKIFNNTGDDEYEKIAYEVALFHHERWNGNGYPKGLSKEEIPLSARIMAVADVFDAVSAKRCYRDAIPLDECFEIIKNGSGQDFDPVIANLFLEMKERITDIHKI